MNTFLKSASSLHRRAQSRLGTLQWNSLLLFLLWRLGDVGNVLYQLILGRKLEGFDYGAVQPVIAVISFLAVPIAVIYQIGTKSMSRLLAMGRSDQCAALARDMIRVAILGSLVSIAVVFALGDYILVRLHLQGSIYTWILSGMLVLAWWGPLSMALIRGSQTFWLTVIPNLTNPVLTIGLTLLFVVVLHLGLPGALLVRVLTGAVTAAFIFVAIRKVYLGTRAPYADEIAVMRPMVLPMTIFVSTTTLLFNFDPLLVRNFMVADSAGYGAVMTLGRIPLWFVGPVIFIMLPLIASEHAGGRTIDRFYREGVCMGLIVTGVMAAGAYLFGGTILSAWNPSFGPYGHLLWLYALTTGMDGTIQIIAGAEMARHRYRCMIHLVLPTVVMCGLLYLIRNTLSLDELLRMLASTRLIIILGLFLSVRLAGRRT